VENSVLSPGVIVKKGAVVRDSVIFADCVIEKDARVDLVVCDKRVNIGRGAVVGYGDNKDIPNSDFPSHLYTGITLVGKGAAVPAGMKIGRNCIVRSGYNESKDARPDNLEDGGIL
jgi:glucose-1-phosphate adenylyltransferase